MIDLSIERGTFCAIVGPRGAGKSALLRILADWYTPARGAIYFGSGDLQALAADPYARLRAIVHLIADGATVVAELHDYSTIAHFADRVIVVRAGTIVASGPPASVLQDRALERSLCLPCAA
jgi:ABC-type cobalamin/Fe3+-siderophores transport system ATPase subunit